MEVKLSDVEVRLFLAKITLYNFNSIKPFFGIMDEYPLLQKHFSYGLTSEDKSFALGSMLYLS